MILCKKKNIQLEQIGPDGKGLLTKPGFYMNSHVLYLT